MKKSSFNLKKILLFPINILSKYISQDEFKLSSIKIYDILELNNDEYLLHKNFINI